MPRVCSGQPEWTETLPAVCFDCNRRHQSCAVAYPHQCLMAQGWCQSQRNWYCDGCSDGLWRPPPTSLVTCRHKDELLDRIATMAGLHRRAHDEVSRSSSWPRDRRTEVRDQRLASLAQSWTQRIAEINAPLEDRPIGARLGAATCHCCHIAPAGPDPSFDPSCAKWKRRRRTLGIE